MNPSDDELASLADVAIRAATESGEMIARSRPTEIGHKDGGVSAASQVVTEIDRRSEDIIVGHLAPTLEPFGLGLLTEERADDGGRHRTDAFWCVDPLDGTLPFVEGASGSAVSIALVRRDGTPLLGVIVDPVTSTRWHAIRGLGAFRNGAAWSPPEPSTSRPLVVYADRRFLAGDDAGALVGALEDVARGIGRDAVDIRVGAGAVMNALGVLDHAPAGYLKLPAPAGGGSLWDFAATACLFTEVGAPVTDIHGEPLDLNRTDSTFMHHRGVVFATDAALADALRSLHPRGS